MTRTRLRWVTRTITAVALLSASIMSSASVSSARAAEPKLAIDDVRVTEGNTGTRDLVFTVTLSATSSAKVTVAFATGGGDATAGTDYTQAQGTVSFAARQRSATIRVPVVGDTAYEPDETVEVRLSNPVRATIADGLGVGTISNDDTAPPPPTTTTPTPTGGQATVSVWIDGWGSGTVTSSPAGISCHVQYSGDPYGDDFTGSMTGPCDASFAVGSPVTLTATADPGSHLNSMDCGTYANPCTRTVTSGYNPVWVSFCPDNNGLCFPG